MKFQGDFGNAHASLRTIDALCYTERQDNIKQVSEFVTRFPPSLHKSASPDVFVASGRDQRDLT